ncbi:LAME_0F10418g1_1 [Lachancea meyersii CBS 8951]|uniref:LAME_0F10418g1_1 n=1 Tax=Lachancea meyersii CBS 8951 TaxID=1266667 RepID=A0A1G4JVW4_9SACH|nr:LAME_0F10418g1_1 [Lachancea meyersii CBS 8951]
MSTQADASQADAFAHALAGAGGGAMSMALTYPLVAVTTKMQTLGSDETPETVEKQGLVATIKDVYKKHGVVGFFAGLESAVIGMAFSSFVYYYCYEASSRCIMKYTGKQRLNTAESMLVGTIAGSVNAAATNPLWVANTRMTVDKTERNTLRTILDIAHKDGPATLFNGLKPALVLVINPIIQYTVFEQLKNTILEKSHSRTLSPSWAFLSGALGKLIATGSTYPYVTMKARMHLKGKQKAHSDKPTAPTSLVSLMMETVKKNGVSELYRGIGLKLVQSVLTAAFLFFFKEGLVLWSIKALKTLSQLNRRRRLLNKV